MIASAILFVDTDIIYAYHVTGRNLHSSPSALFVNAINLISVGYRNKKFDILDVKNKTLDSNTTASNTFLVMKPSIINEKYCLQA